MRNLIFSAIMLAACDVTKHPDDRKPIAPPPDPPAPTAMVVQICREDTDIQGHIDRLTREGWRYAGPLTPNGINCYISLWTKP